MQQKHNAVRLLKNEIYPTYQLFAEMDNDKTKLRDALRLAALTVIDWLKNRLGENTPQELSSIPTAENYKNCSDDCLESLYINEGYVINIVSLPQKGMWSLQITEPHLGSDPGNPNQDKSAVPGRILETNIAFKINDNKLECGFCMLVSDPEGIEEKADSYRFAVIKTLANHPDFRLRQILPIDSELRQIASQRQLDLFLQLRDNTVNQMPLVVFTQLSKKKIDISDIKMNNTLMPGKIPSLLLNKAVVNNPTPPKKELDYDTSYFASSGLGYCRTFLLSSEMLDAFSRKMHVKFTPGDILIFEPIIFGGSVSTFKYKDTKKQNDDTFARLKKVTHNYTCGKDYNFGQISFLSSTRSELIRSTDELMKNSQQISQDAAQKLVENTTKWRAELDLKDREISRLKEKIANKDDEIFRAKHNASNIVEQSKEELNSLYLQIERYKSMIEFYKRCADRPQSQHEIVAWVNKYFENRLFFHKKAISLLEDSSSEKVNTNLICDALDFLATDYWDCIFADGTEDEMRKVCSEKYDRPFIVTPLSDITIEHTPSEYKIKYFIGKDGKLHESALDKHLKVGNKADNLLRIYFLHDYDKKLIVIGSLPNHLSNVKKA